MANLIDIVRANLAKENLEIRTKKARDWLRRNLKNLQVNQKTLLSSKDSKFVRNIIIGKMYFYSYDPKLKQILPYYDRFPLIIPIEKYDDGFLGLNLHYLSTKQRLILLDKLYATLNNKKYDDTTKLKINYNILSHARRYKEFEPCVKRYLYSHLRSRIMEIPADDWEIGLFLPTEQFVKATATKVQRDSIRSII